MFQFERITHIPLYTVQFKFDATSTVQFFVSVNRGCVQLYKHYSFLTAFLCDTFSSLGQNLFTSTYVGEINFAIIIAILGLVLFGLLIGNMQVSLAIPTLYGLSLLPIVTMILAL